MTDQIDSIGQLIQVKVLPQWTAYLNGKLDDKVNNNNVGNKRSVRKRRGEIRNDTIWKKIFRDLREFLRLMIKARFHPLDYKTDEGRNECLKLILLEMGFN